MLTIGSFRHWGLHHDRLAWGTAIILFAAALAAAGNAAGQKADRSGKQVVDGVCISCHGTGANGAPKIGDRNAWAARASQGLTSLTQHALDGIRRMPSHGGNPGLSDTEIERAITYMVNQSGGNWTEPISRTSQASMRTGEQIYEAQCSKCHRSGLNGAPRVGDNTAWVPRLKQGVDGLVRSAINGHGGMPPRGGQANLTDAELRRAVIFMFNPGFASATAKVTTTSVAVSAQDPRIVGGTAIHFGAIPADAIRRNPREYPQKSYGVPPPGPDQYYLTIALFDAASGKRVSDATVRARVSTASSAGPEKALEPVTTADAPTYGNYFAMGGTGPFEIVVRISRPGAADTIETKFQYAR
jgi:cytochrome c5